MDLPRTAVAAAVLALALTGCMDEGPGIGDTIEQEPPITQAPATEPTTAEPTTAGPTATESPTG